MYYTCTHTYTYTHHIHVHIISTYTCTHTGVYGEDYSVCPAIVLLSLPAVPRCLLELPDDILSELKFPVNQLPPLINNPITDQKSLFDITEQNKQWLLSNLHHISLGRDISYERIVARRVVRLALEAACNRKSVSCGGSLPSIITMKDMGIGDFGMEYRNSSYNRMDDGMEIWNETGSWSPKQEEDNTDICAEIYNVNSIEGRKCLTGRRGLSSNENQHFELLGARAELVQCSTDIQISSTNTAEVSMAVRAGVMSGLMDIENSMSAAEVERRNVAKRLVLKCIRAACESIVTRERGSIENLIASTKRMRIDSPSPSNETTQFILKSSSPLPDRCMTPESMKMQKLRKKRGRSESHEVNSLIDYDMMRSKLHSTPGDGVKGAKVTLAKFNGGLIEEEENTSDDELNSILSNLEMMSLTQSSTLGDQEKHRNTSLNLDIKISPAKNFDAFRLHSPCHAPPQGVTTPIINSNMYSDARIDARIDAGSDSIPEMDFYVIIHSCPPRGMCQKFLCSNTDEINVLYHCWLFDNVPCDPSLTVSNQLKMGVFDPHCVQPVHLDLEDGGVPFQHLEMRCVCMYILPILF